MFQKDEHDSGYCWPLLLWQDYFSGFSPEEVHREVARRIDLSGDFQGRPEEVDQGQERSAG